MAMAIWLHLAACVWFYVGETGWTEHNGIGERSPSYQYLTSLHWAATQFQGNSDVSPGSSGGERFVAVMVVLVSILFSGIFLSELTSAIVDAAALRRSQGAKLEATHRFLVRRKVSFATSMLVKRHIKHEAKAVGAVDEACVLEMLPERLNRQLLNEIRQPVLAQHVVMRAWFGLHMRSFSQLCCEHLEAATYHPDDIIFSFLEVCQNMFFVQDGVYAYCKFSPLLEKMNKNVSQAGSDGGNARTRESFGEGLDASTAALTKAVGANPGMVPLALGDYLCEPVIWCPWQHRGDLAAVTFGTMLHLHVGAVTDLVGRYPTLKSLGGEHAANFAEMLRIKGRSDLFDSLDCIREHHQAASSFSKTLSTPFGF